MDTPHEAWLAGGHRSCDERNFRMKTASKRQTLRHEAQSTLAQRIWDARYIYLLLLPGIVYFAVMRYGPMYGLVLAFKKYSAHLGILGSQWVGMKNFERIFITPAALKALQNTIEISLGRLVFEFPVPIILALMLNEMRGGKAKKIYQTIFTFPHFLSWVVVGTMLINLLSDGGTVNMIARALGGESINFLAQKQLARPLLYITSSWKGMGWSSIIYLAAISGIDPALYEAAMIDGANRGRRVWHVTLPSILPTIMVLFILEVGNIMNSGFNQIFNLQNAVIKPVIEVLDTYIYEITFNATPDYGFSTAVGLFKSAVNLIMLVIANTVVKRIRGQGLFGGGDTV